MQYAENCGMLAEHEAALRGNRRIVRSLVALNADVNAQNQNGGCAVSACGESAVSAVGRVRRRPPCRYTPLHWAAGYGHSASVVELLLRGADGAVQNFHG